MAVHTMTIAKDLLAALGLSDQQVTHLAITLDPDSLVEVDVRILAQEQHGEELCELLKRYHLVEDEPPEDGQ